jgi:hypothetical protein
LKYAFRNFPQIPRRANREETSHQTETPRDQLLVARGLEQVRSLPNYFG